MCEHCIHKKVCKHKFLFEEVEQDLHDKIKDCGLPIIYDLQCQYYAKEEEF